MLHEKGYKSDRDRAMLLASYQSMVKEFRTPRSRRLSTAEIARMTNAQLYQASKDLYNGQPLKKAQKLAVKLGVASPAPTRVSRALWWVQTLLFGIRVKVKPVAAKAPRRSLAEEVRHA